MSPELADNLQALRDADNLLALERLRELGPAVFDAAVAQGLPAVACEAAYVTAREWFNRGEHLPALEWAARAMTAAPVTQAPLVHARTGVVLACAHAKLDQPEAAIAAVHQVLDRIAAGLPASVTPSLLTGLSLAYEALKLPHQALAMARAAVEALPADAVGTDRLTALLNLVNAAGVQHETLRQLDPGGAAAALQQAVADSETLAALADELKLSPAASLRVDACCGRVLRHAGRFEEACRLLERAWALCTADASHAPALQLQVLTELVASQRDAGHLEAASEHAQAAVALAERLSDRQAVSAHLQLASQMAELRGDHAEALALFKRYHALALALEQQAAAARIGDMQAAATALVLRTENAALRERRDGLQQSVDSLNRDVFNDALTGVANRRALEQRYQALQVRPLVLVMLDVDHFKRVNDRCSHVVGDRVLRQVAQVLAAHVRGHDFLARYGGEEFTALLPEMPPAAAAQACERLRAAVQAVDWATLAPGLAVTISLGAVAAWAGESFEAAVERADRCLYRAKQGGRNRAECDFAERPPGP